MNKKGMDGGISVVTAVAIGVILLILVFGIFSTLGTKITQDFRTDKTGLCVAGSGATWNESVMACYNGSAINLTATTGYAWASANSTGGLSIAGAQTPTISSVGGFVIIIAMLALVAGIAYKSFM